MTRAALPDIDWVTVPAGVLVRGTDERDVPGLVRDHADLGIPADWFLKECPRVELAVPQFAISRTTVTRAQWAPFAREQGLPGQPADDHPVTGVDWKTATEYCAWLADRTGLAVRLPSETEWERAARGDDARAYPWGDRFDDAHANLLTAGNGGPVPVGSFPSGAGPFGTLDMAGNVDEWTSTRYEPYPGAPASVPPAENWASDPHVTRGGSWRHNRDLARCARRHAAYDETPHDIGFRLAAAG
ncbi:SUMF1/EgtB/PvdO family nonheme iron enzyme [Streptomyces sp. ST1015]|uniref:formylglycine-generating enzyme family protein n=1 Tax=unclassified Streptomyces TaxID=2593676 RepID=UPI001CA68E0D|nr:SUMF1/EgtB/PvdO family nonheme iron enzyme [Streptomyces sp. ST1015]QZZ25370.1 formylglycine-generating enzyme family protein [Streptomyces sp. ST1015]